MPPDGGRDSPRDVFALMRDCAETMAVVVVTKAAEPFGRTLRDWLAEDDGGGSERLDFIRGRFGLPPDALDAEIGYEFLERAAADVVEAERFKTDRAATIVQSFSPDNRRFKDFARFAVEPRSTSTSRPRGGRASTPSPAANRRSSNQPAATRPPFSVAARHRAAAAVRGRSGTRQGQQDRPGHGRGHPRNHGRRDILGRGPARKLSRRSGIRTVRGRAARLGRSGRRHPKGGALVGSETAAFAMRHSEPLRGFGARTPMALGRGPCARGVESTRRTCSRSFA